MVDLFLIIACPKDPGERYRQQEGTRNCLWRQGSGSHSTRWRAVEILCAVKRRRFSAGKNPARRWVAPAGSNRSATGLRIPRHTGTPNSIEVRVRTDHAVCHRRTGAATAPSGRSSQDLPAGWRTRLIQVRCDRHPPSYGPPRHEAPMRSQWLGRPGSRPGPSGRKAGSRRDRQRWAGTWFSHQSPRDRAPALESATCAAFSVSGFCSVPPANQASTA